MLAAGLSTRMGANKLLLPWRDGKPIIAHVTQTYLDAGVENLVVVTGRDAAAVRACLSALAVTFAHNPDYATGGMVSSVQAGLRALGESLRAVFIQPGDMPCVSGAVIQALARAHQAGISVAPCFDGQRGHPVLLDRSRWAAMLALAAGSMPRAALDKSSLRLLHVDDGGVLVDVDTRAAYERALELGEQRNRRKLNNSVLGLQAPS